MARSQAERDTAFAAGKLAAEDLFNSNDQDLDAPNSLAWYGLRSAEVPDDLQEEFKEGWQYCSQNIGLANYVVSNDVTRARVKRLIEGRHQIEETPAQIVVAPATVKRIDSFLALDPLADMDSIINLALDALDLMHQTYMASGLDETLTPRKLEDRLHAVIREGQTYWDYAD